MRSFIVIMIVATLALTASFAAAKTFAAPEFTSVDVALVKLPFAVERPAGPAGGSKSYTHGYLVRLHGTRFPATAVAWQLWFGDTRIEEYGSFDGGAYFVVYERAELDALAGKPIRVSIRAGEFHPSPAKLVVSGVDGAAMPFDQALARK